MQTVKKGRSVWGLAASMCIFATIGILRKGMDFPSSFLALCRALIGTVFLLLVVMLSGKRMDFAAIRRNLPWLALSGAALGFNWIFLFEAYHHTTVTTATLCYYMAPSIVVLASHFLFGERLAPGKGICVLVAFFGMVLVSGAAGSGIPEAAELRGILFGLAAAVLYACVMLLNKKIHVPSPFDKTIFQLGLAGIILLPYTLLTENPAALTFTPLGIALLLTAGIVHTGIAYALYFGSIPTLPTRTVALLSYIDPVLAILLSAVLLREPMGTREIIGSILILGAAYISEK